MAEGTEIARLQRRISFVSHQALSSLTHHHLCRQGVAFASTRQLRSQALVSVHAHRTEGVTGSEGREGANGVGGRIGVGGGDGDGVGDGNGDVNDHGDGDRAGAGKGPGVEANKRAQDRNGGGSGNGAGTGTVVETPRRTQDGNGDGNGDENENCLTVAEMGTGTRLGAGTGTRTGSGRTEERLRSARNHTRTTDATRHFYSTRVIIYADRG